MAAERGEMPPNHLLASLPAADFDLIRPHLKPVDLPNEKLLFRTGDPITHAYFPESSSLTPGPGYVKFTGIGQPYLPFTFAPLISTGLGS
jgi:hypothetical protein